MAMGVSRFYSLELLAQELGVATEIRMLKLR